MTETKKTFRDLGLSESLLQAIEQKGFTNPTPIQEQTIPLLLNSDHDIIGQAQTGTGKTAAFGLPVIDRLEENAGYIQAVVLTPTRELALQVSTELRSFKGNKNIFINEVYGGQSYDLQKRKLNKGCDVLVGTPGRVIDHLQNGVIDFSKVRYFILDEADEMLNMGFYEDIEKVLTFVGKDRQVLLFSATMPERIKSLAKRFLRNVEHIKVASKQMTTTLTEQFYFVMAEKDHFETLCRLIDSAEDFYGMVFCNTKRETDFYASRLSERGYASEPLHGDIAQNQREAVLKRFRNRQTRVLVCTDVAARGIDVDDLTHVVNISIPQDPESYVHRIGRTGRAGKTGIAFTIVHPGEVRRLGTIREVSKASIQKGEILQPDQLAENRRKQIVLKHTAITEDKVALAGYTEIAETLMENADAALVIASLLFERYGETIHPKSYKELREPDRKAKGERSFEGNDRGGERRGRNDRPFGRDRFGSNERGGDRFSSNDRGGDRFGRGEKRAFGSDRPSRATASASGEGGDKSRIFISAGRIDGLSARKLVEVVEENSGLKGRFIDDIKVMDNFSFMTIPSYLAEESIHQLNNRIDGVNFEVSKPKEKAAAW